MVVSLYSAVLLPTAMVSASFGSVGNQHGSQRNQET